GVRELQVQAFTRHPGELGLVEQVARRNMTRASLWRRRAAGVRAEERRHTSRADAVRDGGSSTGSHRKRHA
ncbi:hypothetical protein ACWEQO_19605, partial [Streptomyces sp. NPDC004051]